MATSTPLATVRPVPQLARAHEQVAEYYRDRIRTGHLAPGGTFPSIREIAEEWGGISANTVARAVKQLRTEGWIEVSQGRRPTVVGVPAK